MLSRSMYRDEGFRLCEEILRGQLPGVIPVTRPDQRRLTAMDEFAQIEVLGRKVKWVALEGTTSTDRSIAG